MSDTTGNNPGEHRMRKAFGELINIEHSKADDEMT